MKRGKEMASGKPVLPRMQALRAENRELREAVNGSIEQNLKQLAEIEELKDKVAAYMESASMYKGENEDLRVRCEEVEEMLRQEESKLEIANKEKLELCEKIAKLEADAKLYQETILELQEAKQQKENVCSMYFGGINKAMDEIEELLKEVARLKYELKIINKPWYKKLFEGLR